MNKRNLLYPCLCFVCYIIGHQKCIVVACWGHILCTILHFPVCSDAVLYLTSREFYINKIFLHQVFTLFYLPPLNMIIYPECPGSRFHFYEGCTNVRSNIDIPSICVFRLYECMQFGTIETFNLIECLLWKITNQTWHSAD